MNVRTLLLAGVIAGAFALPAAAQQSVNLPLQDQLGPRIPHAGFGPSAAEAQTANTYENPAVRSTAERVYAQLVASQLNRARLTPDVDKAFSQSTEQSLSQQLSKLGTPSWTFVKNIQSEMGAVSVYRLTYTQGSAYMTFGVDDNGIVYALLIASSI